MCLLAGKKNLVAKERLNMKNGSAQHRRWIRGREVQMPGGLAFRPIAWSQMSQKVRTLLHNENSWWRVAVRVKSSMLLFEFKASSKTFVSSWWGTSAETLNQLSLR